MNLKQPATLLKANYDDSNQATPQTPTLKKLQYHTIEEKRKNLQFSLPIRTYYPVHFYIVKLDTL